VSHDSTLTVILAGAANLGIAAAKLVAGIASGSAAMLAEAAHSVGDTVNQAMLLASLRRSQRPADAEHPFGYGMERYFWSLLAAVGIFVLGAGFAAYQGISALRGGGHTGPLLWSFVVLAAAFAFEGTSFVRALWQLRRDAAARDVRAWRHLRTEADPALRAVVFEDGVALVGLLLAGGGLALDHVTGSSTWDAVASLAIAALLVAVAYGLGRQNQQYLIGKAVDDETLGAIREQIASAEGVDVVLEVLTMRLSPDQVLVAARVDLADDLTAEQIEHASDDVEIVLKQRFPEIRHVFLDPTPG
jgi:cation diffusion facilitator family transporter